MITLTYVYDYTHMQLNVYRVEKIEEKKNYTAVPAIEKQVFL